MIQLGTYYFKVHLAAEILDVGICFFGFEDPDAQLFNYIHYLFAKPCVFIIQNEQRQLLTVIQSSTVYCLESEARRS